MSSSTFALWRLTTTTDSPMRIATERGCFPFRKSSIYHMGGRLERRGREGKNKGGEKEGERRRKGEGVGGREGGEERK